MTPKQKRKSSLLIICLSLLGLIIAGVVYERRPQFYPYVVVQSGEPLQIRFLQHSVREIKHCEARVKRVAEALMGRCHVCRLVEARCLSRLDPLQRKFLYGQPVDVPTMRIPEGAIAFFASTPELALQTCKESASETTRQLRYRECSQAGLESLQLSVTRASDDVSTVVPGAAALWLIALIAAAVACLCTSFIVRFDRWHSWFSHDSTEAGPQKFHAVPTPRIGGFSLAAALTLGVAAMQALNWPKPAAIEGLMLLTIAAIPAFAAGFAEDITKKVGVLARLMLTISGGVMASLLVGATLDRIDIPGVDTLLLQWPVFAIAFTAFAVGGVANAINIIDGYNGLVGGYAIMVLAALGFVSAQVGDPVVLAASITMAGALLGFLVWNYPKGRIFLGDGGAYLLGFWAAELSVLLVARNPGVSPWFPMVLLAYPVFETFFSIFRRIFVRGGSAGHPDALHLHQLIYLRLARIGVGSRLPEDITRRNSMVAIYVWAANAVFMSIAVLVWQHTLPLIGLVIAFCAGYVWLYVRMIRWRAPSWLIAAPTGRAGSANTR